MREMHDPSSDFLIAHYYAGRFARHDDMMWFDGPTACEVVEFCATQGIAVVRIDEEWDWPEGRQHGIVDHGKVLQRSLTWNEVVETCAGRARLHLGTRVMDEPGAAVSFTFYTETAWLEHYA